MTGCRVPVPTFDQIRPARSLNSMVLPTQVMSQGMVRPFSTSVTVSVGAAYAGVAVPAVTRPAVTRPTDAVSAIRVRRSRVR